MGSFSIRINASAILYCLSPTGFSIRINASAARFCLSPTGFSIRINASAVLYCVSPTGECALKLRLYINLSVRCKIFAHD